LKRRPRGPEPEDVPLSREGRREAFHVFREALDAAGFRPSRRLGQNFLLDGNMAAAIVRDAGIAPGDRVVEVGAGCGFLGLHLLQAGAELLCVEIDPRLRDIAARLLADRGPVRFLLADALAGKHALAPALEAELPPRGAWKLVSSLPYSISAPLLAILAHHPRAPADMTVLVQREVARRITARAGTPEWGPLSIRLQCGWSARSLRAVPAGLFWPRPAVESALVRLEPHSRPGLALRARALEAWVPVLFRHRRQALARVLSEALGSREEALELLASLRIAARDRAEVLELELLEALCLRLGEARPGTL